MTAEPLRPLPEVKRRRELRREIMGLTIAEAAAEIGVSPRTYARWESGAGTPAPANHRAYQVQLRRWEAAACEVARGLQDLP